MEATELFDLQFSRINISMSDEETFTPCEQQRIMGAGITRRKIDFVPAAVAPSQPVQLAPQTTSSQSPADRYLNFVLKTGPSVEEHKSTSTKASNHERSSTRQQLDLEGSFCEICNLAIDARGGVPSTASTDHEYTIAHMVCLTHSHPPSHLDRSRQGFKYLSSYGWDPDTRQGLGATGGGIRVPIKIKVKNDTVGLGVKINRKKKSKDAKVERMDAKQIRRKDMEDRRKRERLQEMFYSNDNVEKYLGGG